MTQTYKVQCSNHIIKYGMLCYALYRSPMYERKCISPVSFNQNLPPLQVGIFVVSTNQELQEELGVGGDGGSW